MSRARRRPLVVHRDDDAKDAQARIRTLTNLLDGLEQVVGAFEREVRRLDRNQQVRRGHQRVDRQQPERRRAVDDDVGILPLQLIDLVLQPEVRVHLPHQPRFELGEADARRRDRQVRQARRKDDVLQADRRVRDRVVGAAADRRCGPGTRCCCWPAGPDRSAALCARAWRAPRPGSRRWSSCPRRPSGSRWRRSSRQSFRLR